MPIKAQSTAPSVCHFCSNQGDLFYCQELEAYVHLRCVADAMTLPEDPDFSWSGFGAPRGGLSDARKAARELAKQLEQKCECDNTHEQNKTVCTYCWAAGLRYHPPATP